MMSLYFSVDDKESLVIDKKNIGLFIHTIVTLKF